MYTSTDAIILSKLDYKESSLISRFFTYEQGKISTIIKGAKKNNVIGFFEPSNIVHCTYYNGKSSLKIVQELTLKNFHYNTRNNLLAYYYSMAVVAILDKSTKENYQLKDLFNLSVYILDTINNQKTNLDIIFIYFLIHLTNHLGFKFIIDSKLDYDDEILDLIETFNNCHDIAIIDHHSLSPINKIKIILYKHIKYHLFDLNDIYALKMIKQIKNETPS